MKLCVIPARGGSKRIPGKNIRSFAGKPIIAYSIEAALESECFDHVIVSTDDDNIAQVARNYGAEVPFIRPAELSDDFTGTTAVIAHATQWAIDHGITVTDICCIYPTAPLIQVQDIQTGEKILETALWEYVFSAVQLDPQVFRSFSLNNSGGVEMLFPQYFTSRTQDLPVVMQDAAQFYWGKVSAWLEGKSIFAEYSTYVKLPSYRVQDIDTQDDWDNAELIFQPNKR
ncbi:pseudaminic acid cytidylyltransferase, partial [Methylophaga muralis]|uniref:pseudaminic acid cytidylyltransferase n=1 Tax=Methylophaga muralis TaxID=291169 RepID=UPI000845EC18